TAFQPASGSSERFQRRLVNRITLLFRANVLEEPTHEGVERCGPLEHRMMPRIGHYLFARADDHAGQVVKRRRWRHTITGTAHNQGGAHDGPQILLSDRTKCGLKGGCRARGVTGAGHHVRGQLTGYRGW